MILTFQRAIPLALLTALLLGSGVEARQATPAALAITVDPAECTVEPRPREELRELARAGLPRVVAAIQGTPSGGDGDESEATPPAGEPADAATTAAVTETIGQYTSCITAGNLPAIAAVLTRQGASVFLAFSAYGFLLGATGGAATPSADIDPALLDAWAAAIAFPVPSLPEARVTSYEVREVKRMDDGRVVATVLLAIGTEAPDETTIELRQEDGRYRIIFGDESDGAIDGTPVVATPVT